MDITKKTILISIFIVLIVLLGSKIIINRAFIKECSTYECFISRAEKCAPTIYSSIAGDTVIKNEITPNCDLIKTVIGYVGEPLLPEAEQEKIKCRYERNRFEITLEAYDTMLCSPME